MKRWMVFLLAACSCIEWTRFEGEVKWVDVSASKLTLETRMGAFVIPLDPQVQVTNKHGEIVSDISKLALNERVTLEHLTRSKMIDDTQGMALPEPQQRGK